MDSMDSTVLSELYPLDLCMMAAKIVYENKAYVQRTVTTSWKMYFAGHYNFWNEALGTEDTQAFICCDRQENAQLILVAFRGTEPFNTRDWVTDVDLSWMQMGEMGRVHVGFMKALGLQDEKKGAFVGTCIGTDSTSLPSAVDIVAILKAHQITHVRLFDADHHMLNALAHTGIEVMVGVTNEELLGIGKSPSVAAAWVSKNVAAYLPETNITALAVGSEVLNKIPHVAPVLVPAMSYLYHALVASNLNFQIKVSSPQSMDVISRAFPPSTATFNSTWNSTIYQYLQFLKNTSSFYMLNAYPYYGYSNGDGLFPIEYALFQSLPKTKEIVDPNTVLRYTSMFDAMVDATYYSMEALNFSGIPVIVTESGWPWVGGVDEPDATVENAETYNNNLIRRVLNDSGPPSHPSLPVSSYIYELFNEDKQPGSISEKNWGMFYTNGTAVYSLSLNSSTNSSSTGVFCIAKQDADSTSLEAGLNWACGQGKANCLSIQEGQPCYKPNTLQNHASFAYNDYYHRTKNAGGTCDFGGTATISDIDPSHGSCVFTGSSKSANNGGATPFSAYGPASLESARSTMLQVSLLAFLIPMILMLFQV